MLYYIILIFYGISHLSPCPRARLLWQKLWQLRWVCWRCLGNVETWRCLAKLEISWGCRGDLMQSSSAAAAAPAAVAERQWPPCAVFSHVSIWFSHLQVSVVHLRIFSQREVRACKPRVGSKANTLIFLEMSNGSGSAKDQRENEPRPAIAPVMSGVASGHPLPAALLPNFTGLMNESLADNKRKSAQEGDDLDKRYRSADPQTALLQTLIATVEQMRQTQVQTFDLMTGMIQQLQQSGNPNLWAMPRDPTP